MKKLLSAIAIVAMFSVSCVRETPVDAPKAGITVRIAGNGSAATRVESDAADNVIPAIEAGGTHYVYVIEGGTVVHSEALTVTTADEEQILAAGEKIFAPNAQVYILANIPSNTTGGNPGLLGTMDAIEQAVSAISYSAGINTDYEHPAMGNSSGGATDIGAADDDGMASVAIEISPLYARVELQGIKGGEWIKSFTVKNIYLDEYFSSFSMTGEGAVMNTQGQSTDFAAGWFGDPADIDWAAAPDAAPAAPENDQVWAYHVGAGSLVRIIVELENVVRFKSDNGTPEKPTAEPEEDSVEGPTFVTVTGYKQTLTSFDRGYIYSIKPVTFNKVGAPNDDMVAITADVTIHNWIKEELDPTSL